MGRLARRQATQYMAPTRYGSGHVYHNAQLDPGTASTITDLIGTRNATAGVGAMPVLETVDDADAPSGNRYWKFDGTNDFLTYGQATDWGQKSSDGIVAFFVMRGTGSGVDGPRIIGKMSAGPVAHDFLYDDGVEAYGMFYRDGTERLSVRWPMTPNVWHVVAMRYDGSMAASGAHALIDGSEPTPTVLFDTLVTDSTPSNNATIGESGGIFMDGDAALLAAWIDVGGPDPLNSDQLYRLSWWAGAQFGIEVSP